MGAEEITRALGGDWLGRSGRAACPVCQTEGWPRQRALVVSECLGGLSLDCEKAGCDALATLQEWGWVEGRKASATLPLPIEAARHRQEELVRQRECLDAAHDLFKEGVSCDGTPAETYLAAAHGISGLRLARMGRTLRFHPAAFHAPTGRRLPAILARIRASRGRALGVHRTFLSPDGSSRADVQPSEMILGPHAGGAVRLGPDARMIALAEDLWTALAIKSAARLTVWAIPSKIGFRGFAPPPLPSAEVVLIAAHPERHAAAEAAARNIQAGGRAASIIQPPRAAANFNEILRQYS
ncbi:DUF7146 domain-containing protein [Rhodovulum sp. YNF3179]|uniref:DUF7146 domain-containing protein n=1 Tax=Rhodovulum sp. YNF3179 TaxID=3425127 RepID=UPI003D341F84